MIKSLSLSAAAIFALAPAMAIAAPSMAKSRMAKPLTEAQARQEIQLDGYSHVTKLHQAKNGWTATAQEGGKTVKLLVNAIGVSKV